MTWAEVRALISVTTNSRRMLKPTIETTRRSSGRRVSYNYKEAFKSLELSGSESEAEQQDAGKVNEEEEEPDDFFPPAEGEVEEDPDEFMVDTVEGPEEQEEEEEEDDDDHLFKRPKKVRRKETASSGVSVTSARTAKGSTRTTGISGVRCMGTPGIGGARYVALDIKTPGTVTIRQRAINEWRDKGQESRFKNLFGPSSEDLRPVFETKRRWLSQETLPSRSLEHLAHSPFVADDVREKEARTLREWYANFGRVAFSQGQHTTGKSEQDVQSYLVNPGPETLNLMVGSRSDRRVYRLKKRGYMSAAAPFGPQDTRKGWYFHLGSRIQDAHWAPNENGSIQYLAIAVEQTDPAAKKHKNLGSSKAPAFTKTNPFPASIQIWAFFATADGSLDKEKEPRLVNVICTDWGAPKSFKWWPVGAQDSAEHDEDREVHLGLLAGLWSDGKVRILDVSFKQHPEPQYIHYAKAAIELAFSDPLPEYAEEANWKDSKPSTLPSCLCWLSPTTIAVGTASGIVAIWTLTRSGVFPSSASSATERPSPRPWFHKQVADTYILTLSSGYPSHPQYISVTTGDGFSRLVDLRAPLADAIASPRGRAIVNSQVWHEHTQSFVMIDEYYMLKHSTLRRYHQAIYTFRADSTLTAVTASPVHPAVLIGSADGCVVALNGLCKLLNSKDMPWSQTWFKHEWRRPIQVDTPDDDSTVQHESSSPCDPATFTGPLARVAEGYKAVQTGIVTADSKRPNDGAKFITVFEENSAVTKVVWNPNLKFGTWAAAGMQSGMLRVEDLGV